MAAPEEPETCRIAIVGPSGGTTAHPLTPKMLESALARARTFVEQIRDTVHEDAKTGTWRLRLVCTGDAWCGHLAVLLWQAGVADLELHLACPWDASTLRFADTGSAAHELNPGRRANAQHARFSPEVGFDSLWELHKAVQGIELEGRTRPVVHTHANALARNVAVAHVDFMLAFSHGESEPPPGTTTAHIWDAYTKGGYREHATLA
jgi:hypothetical protein